MRSSSSHYTNRTMIPQEQQHARRMSAQGLVRASREATLLERHVQDAALPRSGPPSLRPFGRMDYSGVAPMQQRRSPGNGTPFFRADPSLPQSYDAYGQVPTELPTNYQTLANRLPKESNYGMEGNSGAGGGLYSMGQGQLTPEYGVTPDRWNFLSSGRDARLQGTRGGMERHLYHQAQSHAFMNNATARLALQQQPMYGGPGNHFVNPRSLTPGRQEAMMRQTAGVEDFFNSSPPEATPQMLGRFHRERKLRQNAAYSNKPSNWQSPHGARHSGMVTAGMPYDPYHTERMGFHPAQRTEYEVPRNMMPQQPVPSQTRFRNIPGNPHDFHQLQAIQSNPTYTQEMASIMRPGRTPALSQADPRALAAFKKTVACFYRGLEEASAMCFEAYKVQKDTVIQRCVHEMRKVMEYIRSVAMGELPLEGGERMLHKIRKKSMDLLEEAQRIKALVESPQSIATTVNAPSEEKEEMVARSESAPRFPLPRKASPAPLHMGPPLNGTAHPERPSKPEKFGADAHPVIVIDDDEPEHQKETVPRKRHPEVESRYQLERYLGNGHATVPRIHPQSVRDSGRKRGQMSPEADPRVEACGMRDTRRRLNPEKLLQTQTPDIQIAVPEQGTPTPVQASECAASNDEKRSVEHDIPNLDEIAGMLELLEAGAVDNRRHDLCRDLRTDDDDSWIYDRRFLEAMANAATPSEETAVGESIPQTAFKPESSIPLHTLADERASGEKELSKPASPFFEEIEQECLALKAELNVELHVTPVVQSDAARVAVEYKDCGVKLLFHPSEPPVISSAVTSNSSAVDRVRRHFLTKVVAIV